MSDFEEKLNAILSDPNAMAQVMQLAQSLNLDGPPPGGSSGNGETTASSEEKPPIPSLGSATFLERSILA